MRVQMTKKNGTRIACVRSIEALDRILNYVLAGAPFEIKSFQNENKDLVVRAPESAGEESLCDRAGENPLVGGSL